MGRDGPLEPGATPPGGTTACPRDPTARTIPRHRGEAAPTEAAVAQGHTAQARDTVPVRQDNFPSD